MSYRVRLDMFEGPLDLLLYLIQVNEIDIYDIPIAKITQEYLGCLAGMKKLDLEVAGEFLVLAATLIHIKSKLLIPVEETAEEGPPAEDPRQELVERLLKYKQFKEAATRFEELEAGSRSYMQGLPIPRFRLLMALWRSAFLRCCAPSWRLCNERRRRRLSRSPLRRSTWGSAWWRCWIDCRFKVRSHSWRSLRG